MKHRAILTALYCVISVVCLSQNKIAGSVIDNKTRQPLDAALIRVISVEKYQTVNEHGSFSLNVNSDSVALEISCIGYKKQVLFAKSGTYLIVALEPDIVNLQALVITPSSTTAHFNTLSKIDLNTRPVKSSQEILRIVPGLFIAQHQGGGKAEQIFLRGFDIDHGTDISISVDGLPVNMVSHAHGQGYADLHFVIPELVKSVDYGKGPYYSAYGDFSTAGYVNLQTTNRPEKNRIQIEAGQYNTLRTLAILNLTDKKSVNQNAYVAAEFLYSDGPFKSPQNFNRFNLMGKYNTKLGEQNELSILGSVFNSNWDASGQVPERAVKSGMIDRFGAIDDTEGGYTGRINGSLKLNSRLKNKATIENQLYYTRYHFNLFSNFTFYLNDPLNGDQIKQREARDIFGYSSKYLRQIEWKGFHVNSTSGMGIRYDRTHGSELSHTLNRNTTLEEIQKGDIHELNAFGYINEEFQKGKWMVNLGVRADYFHFDYLDALNPPQPSQSKIIVSPKINFQYTFNKFFQLYLKTGKGFHSNDTRVVIANQGTAILPAAYGVDLGINWKPIPGLFINAAAWYLFLEQEFIYVGDEGVVEPGNKTNRYGFDLSARYQFTKKLFADIDLNFSHARDAEMPKGMDRIPLAPIFTSTGGLNYKSHRGINGSLRYRYIKDRPANEDNSTVAKGYFVTDLSLNYTRRNYEIGIIAENLFNTKWNEAQFETTSRLKDEPTPVTELHFTPGVPFYLRAKFAIFF